MSFGIYALIIETESGNKFYIGSTSSDFRKRIRQHLYLLRHHIHTNPKLQNYYDKYQNFRWTILQECEQKNTVTIYEQYFISQYSEVELMNLGPALPSPRLGKKLSSEQIEKMRKRNLGRKASEETKKKMTISRLGHRHSHETKVKISQALKNPSEETRKRMSIAQSNKSNETREKISKGLMGNKNGIGKRTQETRNNISKGRRGISSKKLNAIQKGDK